MNSSPANAGNSLLTRTSSPSSRPHILHWSFEIFTLLFWTFGTMLFDWVILAQMIDGITGMTLFLAIFSVPFNLITIGLWTALICLSLARTTPAPGVVAGYQVFEDGRTTRLRPPRATALGTALVATIGVAVGMTFCLACGTAGQFPLAASVIGLIVTLATFPAMFFVSVRKLDAGVHDIVIDRSNGTFATPESARDPRSTISWDELVGFRVKTEERQDDGEILLYYVVLVQWCDVDGHLRETAVTEYREEPAANDLALALRHDLFGLPLPPVVG